MFDMIRGQRALIENQAPRWRTYRQKTIAQMEIRKNNVRNVVKLFFKLSSTRRNTKYGTYL